MQHTTSCKIQYRDIGDYLTREQKLEALQEAVSIKGISDWQTITPNEDNDWIEQRSDAFAQFYPIGTKEAKTGKVGNAIFRLYSRGHTTGRDAYIYNFSHNTCAENARRIVGDYRAAFSELEDNPELLAEEVASRYTVNISWDRELRNNLRRRRPAQFNENYIRKVAYRPYVKTNCYADYIFIQMRYQMHRIFPDSSSENRVICVSGIGSKKVFSAFMADIIPDVQLIFNGQCFPRWQYPRPADTSNTTGEFQGFDEAPERIDNISDTALHAFRNHYSDDTIFKDDIFDYVYGVLHAPSYSEQFANDLSKMIPRIPYASDFRTFAEAGKVLADLHLNYETCEPYPNLSVGPLKPSLLWEEKPEHFRLGTRAMRFADKQERTTLIINEHVCVSGIPEEAHRYVVNGRTPLEWFIDRYKIKQDKNSGIINDPNGWFDNPRDLITAIERIVYVSVESTKIIENLPTQLTDE